MSRSHANRGFQTARRLYFVFRGLKIKFNMPRRPGTGPVGRGNMDKLIGQLASKAGSGGLMAEKTTGIMLGLLGSEGPSGKGQALIDQIRKTEAAIAAASTGGSLSELIGNGIMAVGTRLTAPALCGGEIEDVAGELFGLSRDKIGADRMGEIIAGTPGLSQFT